MRRLSAILLLLSPVIAVVAVIGLQTTTVVQAIQDCNAQPFSEASDMLLFGRPILRVAAPPPTNDLLIREIYELSNNGETKFADWVAYRLDDSAFGEERDPAFATDACLDPDRTLEATPDDEDDYELALSLGYEPIPLAPNATFASSPHWADTQLYSNIVPMHSDLVAEWHDFENDIRAYASQGNEVYVITGPVYRSELPRLPRADEDHQVPSGFWKIVYELAEAQEPDERDSIRYYAILLDQTGCLSSVEAERVDCNSINQNYRRSEIRIVDIEGFTRWDFFHELNNEEEFDVERDFGSLEIPAANQN